MRSLFAIRFQVAGFVISLLDVSTQAAAPPVSRPRKARKKAAPKTTVSPGSGVPEPTPPLSEEEQAALDPLLPFTEHGGRLRHVSAFLEPIGGEAAERAS